ncbi:hypothetical protein BX600DRAFT_453534 [Xylariales sp. PMI_506]|nr:hypothetical protein BX600DRAFT_453534 [Xylariales sp. PMI_506]
MRTLGTLTFLRLGVLSRLPTLIASFFYGPIPTSIYGATLLLKRRLSGDLLFNANHNMALSLCLASLMTCCWLCFLSPFCMSRLWCISPFMSSKILRRICWSF